MKFWSRFACAFVVTPVLVVAQTAPALATPAPATQTPQAPDLTFKPDPTEQQLMPGTVTIKPGTVNPTVNSGAKTPAKPEADKASAGKPASPDEKRYILGANDVVGVTVFDEPHLPGTYAIGPDGRMSLPLIGDFKASGLTLPELQALITEKIEAYINDPVVNVQLLRINSKKYTLLGGVMRAGPFPLVQETTILDALAAAGGLKDFAKGKKIVLRRGGKEFHFNYNEVIHFKNMDQNKTIEDGDIIYVPE